MTDDKRKKIELCFDSVEKLVSLKAALSRAVANISINLETAIGRLEDRQFVLEGDPFADGDLNLEGEGVGPGRDAHVIARGRDVNCLSQGAIGIANPIERVPRLGNRMGIPQSCCASQGPACRQGDGQGHKHYYQDSRYNIPSSRHQVPPLRIRAALSLAAP